MKKLKFSHLVLIIQFLLFMLAFFDVYDQKLSISESGFWIIILLFNIWLQIIEKD